MAQCLVHSFCRFDDQIPDLLVRQLLRLVRRWLLLDVASKNDMQMLMEEQFPSCGKSAAFSQFSPEQSRWSSASSTADESTMATFDEELRFNSMMESTVGKTLIEELVVPVRMNMIESDHPVLLAGTIWLPNDGDFNKGIDCLMSYKSAPGNPVFTFGVLHRWSARKGLDAQRTILVDDFAEMVVQACKSYPCLHPSIKKGLFCFILATYQKVDIKVIAEWYGEERTTAIEQQLAAVWPEATEADREVTKMAGTNLGFVNLECFFRTIPDLRRRFA